jgi:hypothetical protein
MKHRHTRVLVNSWYVQAFCGVCIFAALSHSAHAGPATELAVDVDNFGKISDNYYRGGQPGLIGLV